MLPICMMTVNISSSQYQFISTQVYTVAHNSGGIQRKNGKSMRRVPACCISRQTAHSVALETRCVVARRVNTCKPDSPQAALCIYPSTHRGVNTNAHTTTGGNPVHSRRVTPHPLSLSQDAV